MPSQADAMPPSANAVKSAVWTRRTWPGRWLLVAALLGAALGPVTAARAATVAVGCSDDELIAAIETANATPGDDTLDLQAGCLYVLAAAHNFTTGANGLPVVVDAATAGKLTINGHGATITRGYRVWLPLVVTIGAAGEHTSTQAPVGASPASGGSAPDFRLLLVEDGGNLTLNDLTLENGYLPWHNGGAIYNAGALTANNTTYQGNEAVFGGGIYNTGTLTVTDSSFANNTAATGGGGINSLGDLVVSGSDFSGNSAGLGDSLLVTEGTSNVTDSTLPGGSSFTCPSFPVLVAASDSGGLIDALNCANSSPSDEVINLTNSTYTFALENNNGFGTGPTGLPIILNTGAAGALTINGNGATLARSSGGGTPLFRLLMVDYGAQLTLNNVTIANGHVIDASGGGLLNNGTLALNSSTVTGNAALFGGGLINQFGSAVIISSTFSNNTSVADGAGLASGASLQVQGSLFTHNVSGAQGFGELGGLGGGIVIGGGTAAITATSFISNTAYGNASGAGLCVANGTVTISDSTFADNYGDGAGGGLFNSGGGVVQLLNTTIVNNRGVWGGGVWNGGTMTIRHSTISGNSTTSGNAAGDLGGGGILSNGGTLTLGHTIVAGNSAFNGVDISNTVTSMGYNLIGNTAGLTLTGIITGNLVDSFATPLNLGPLQDNGGPTLTMALLAGSVAIDNGNPSFAPPPAFDQRGVGYPRVAGLHIDIGAFEKP